MRLHRNQKTGYMDGQSINILASVGQLQFDSSLQFLPSGSTSSLRLENDHWQRPFVATSLLLITYKQCVHELTNRITVINYPTLLSSATRYGHANICKSPTTRTGNNFVASLKEFA